MNSNSGFKPNEEKIGNLMLETKEIAVPKALLTQQADCSKKDHDAVIAWIQNTKPSDMTNVALELFPDNYYQRMMFYSWVRSVFNYGKKEFNPTYINMNFIGPAGAGKSGTAYEFGFVMSDFLSKVPGVTGKVPFTIYTTTLQGINDFAEIIGIVHLDHESEQTKLYPNSALPGKTSTSFGMIFMDDFNRGHAHIISAAMEYVNRGKYNNYCLPNGWFFVACTNPQGKNYRTNTLDQAQMTRFLTVEFNPTHKMFLQQLAIQQASGKMIGLFSKYGKELMPDLDKISKSVNEINNNQRSAMMFTHIFPYIENDMVVLETIGRSMFGAAFMVNLKSLLENEMPLDAQEILGDDPNEEKKLFEAVARSLGQDSVSTGDVSNHLLKHFKAKLEGFAKDGKRDLMFTSMLRFESHVIRNYTNCELPEHSIIPFVEFIKLSPAESRFRLLNRLILNSESAISKQMSSPTNTVMYKGKKVALKVLKDELIRDVVEAGIKAKQKR